jgi:hypothetical protein
MLMFTSDADHPAGTRKDQTQHQCGLFALHCTALHCTAS